MSRPSGRLDLPELRLVVISALVMLHHVWLNNGVESLITLQETTLGQSRGMFQTMCRQLPGEASIHYSGGGTGPEANDHKKVNL